MFAMYLMKFIKCFRAVMKFEGNEIILDSMGTDYQEFVSKFEGMWNKFIQIKMLKTCRSRVH